MATVKYNKEHEVNRRYSNGWTLCFQWCRYVYDAEDGEDRHDQRGYRFIWRRPDGTLQAARGQARIPSIQDAMELMEAARKAGWGDQRGES